MDGSKVYFGRGCMGREGCELWFCSDRSGRWVVRDGIGLLAVLLSASMTRDEDETEQAMGTVSKYSTEECPLPPVSRTFSLRGTQIHSNVQPTLERSRCAFEPVLRILQVGGELTISLTARRIVVHHNHGANPQVRLHQQQCRQREGGPD